MEKKYLFGNWKMNMNGNGTERFLRELASSLPEDSKTVLAIFPPFVYLERAIKAMEDLGLTERISAGVQNVHEAENGAYTGEISVGMALDCGASYAIVGHSERRHIFGESDKRISEKVDSCCKAGLKTVLCVGETIDERDKGLTWVTVRRQLESGLSGDTVGPENIIIAYEPVWAIGTGRSASPEDAQDICRAIRSWLSNRFSGFDMPILYGGSVKPENAEKLFSMTDIDGGLIGGASLNADSFLAMM